jgi:excisionase family DNA binding protein
MDEERWFTVAQIAERLKMHEQTVRTWLRTGKMAGRKFGGRGGYRVPESEVSRFMREGPAGKTE